MNCRNNEQTKLCCNKYILPIVVGTMLATVAQGFGLAQQGAVSPAIKHSNNWVSNSLQRVSTQNNDHLQRIGNQCTSQRVYSSGTALNVFWFGGSNNEASDPTNDESCELIAVKIDKISANSRRIGGEISVARPIDDVWAILTDYDNLATHVPNLVESRRINDPSSQTWNNVGGTAGNPGDGSYRCRLYQKGAQKIIGFQFGASVTMDMTEQVLSEGNDDEERKIFFKCVDSQFFSTFDGEWSAKTGVDSITGEPITNLNYVVDVRRKGPVPVAALEWRIREDVPTNLREVKRAATTVGSQGVKELQNAQPTPTKRTTVRTRSSRQQQQRVLQSTRIASVASSAVRKNVKDLVNKASSTVASARSRAGGPQVKLAPVRVSWYDDETMAAYLEE